jgi:hypothetical protein
VIHVPTQNVTWTTPYSDNILVTELTGINYGVIQPKSSFEPELKLLAAPKIQTKNHLFWFLATIIATLTIAVLMIFRRQLNRMPTSDSRNLLENLDDLNEQEWSRVMTFMQNCPMSTSEKSQWHHLSFSKSANHDGANRKEAQTQFIMKLKISHPEWFEGELL